jgi:hypothetical protein
MAVARIPKALLLFGAVSLGAFLVYMIKLGVAAIWRMLTARNQGKSQRSGTAATRMAPATPALSNYPSSSLRQRSRSSAPSTSSATTISLHAPVSQSSHKHSTTASSAAADKGPQPPGQQQHADQLPVTSHAGSTASPAALSLSVHARQLVRPAASSWSTASNMQSPPASPPCRPQRSNQPTHTQCLWPSAATVTVASSQSLGPELSAASLVERSAGSASSTSASTRTPQATPPTTPRRQIRPSMDLSPILQASAAAIYRSKSSHYSRQLSSSGRPDLARLSFADSAAAAAGTAAAAATAATRQHHTSQSAPASPMHRSSLYGHGQGQGTEQRWVLPAAWNAAAAAAAGSRGAVLPEALDAASGGRCSSREEHSREEHSREEHSREEHSREEHSREEHSREEHSSTSSNIQHSDEIHGGTHSRLTCVSLPVAQLLNPGALQAAVDRAAAAQQHAAPAAAMPAGSTAGRCESEWRLHHQGDLCRQSSSAGGSSRESPAVAGTSSASSSAFSSRSSSFSTCDDVRSRTEPPSPLRRGALAGGSGASSPAAGCSSPVQLGPASPSLLYVGRCTTRVISMQVREATQQSPALCDV